MIVRLSRGVVLTKTGEQAIVTSSGHGAAYFRLNQVGVAILELLLEGSSEEEAAAEIARQYKVDVDRVRGDVGTLIESLVRARLAKRT